MSQFGYLAYEHDIFDIEAARWVDGCLEITAAKQAPAQGVVSIDVRAEVVLLGVDLEPALRVPRRGEPEFESAADGGTLRVVQRVRFVD